MKFFTYYSYKYRIPSFMLQVYYEEWGGLKNIG